MREQVENFAEVGGYRVDLTSVASLAHRCDPSLCRGGRSCCGEHDLWIGEAERARVLSRMGAAADHGPRFAGFDSHAEAFVRLAEDAYAIRRDPDGLCVFGCRDDAGRVLCSIHTAALEAGEDPFSVKPRGCVLWPLALTSSRPPVLGVQAGALRYPCNRRRFPHAGMDQGVSELIRGAFGGDFLEALLRELRERGVGSGR